MKKKISSVLFNGTKEQEKKLLEVIEEYKNIDGPLVMILHKTQDIYGYLPYEAMKIISEKLNISINQFCIFKGIQTLFGIIYPCILIMLLVVVNNLQNISTITKFASFEYEISLFLLIFTFAMPIIVDTFAMLTGSLFKGKKLCL